MISVGVIEIQIVGGQVLSLVVCLPSISLLRSLDVFHGDSGPAEEGVADAFRCIEDIHALVDLQTLPVMGHTAIVVEPTDVSRGVNSRADIFRPQLHRVRLGVSYDR